MYEAISLMKIHTVVVSGVNAKVQRDFKFKYNCYQFFPLASFAFSTYKDFSRLIDKILVT
jgi:hypothetical protein